MKENKKNTSVYLWIFIFVVALGLNNLNLQIWNGTEEKLIFTGGNVIAFFMFIAGYALMKHYKENKAKKESSAKKAWAYVGSLYNILYPAFLGGVLLTFIIRNIIVGTKINVIVPMFMDSILEFLGLSQITTGTLWNSPLWIFSSIVIASLILYFIVDKSEELFFGLLAPLFVIVAYSNTGFINAIGLPYELIRVIAGMSIGMLMYYVVEYFQKKKFSENMTMAFSIAHIGIAMIFVYTLYNGILWSEFANGVILLIFSIILLVNKDYISVLYNNSKICEFLGRISIYYYACHIAFAFLLAWLFPAMGYKASLLFNILFSLCWGFIMMYFDDYVVTPLFRKESENNTKKAPVKKTRKTKA